MIAGNILGRALQADRPDHKRLAGFACLWTAEGGLHVAVVADLFSRRVVGWSMQGRQTTDVVLQALMMAVRRRGKAEALLHHSDPGRNTPASSSSA